MHLVYVLKLWELRRDDADDDVLVLGKISRRLETSSTRGVILEVTSAHSIAVAAIERLVLTSLSSFSRISSPTQQ